MTHEQIIREELEQIRLDLIAKYDQLGMRTTGKWADALEVKTHNKGGVILGEGYSWQLHQGRKFGKFPPLKAIEQWIIDKGIEPIDKRLKTSSMAYLIARKIAQKGTRYFQQGGTDLITGVVTAQRIEQIIDKVGLLNSQRIQAEILSHLKVIAQL